MCLCAEKVSGNFRAEAAMDLKISKKIGQLRLPGIFRD